MQKLFLLSLIAVFIYAVEPSAFEAGDLNLPDPYGLTSSEKVILKNKKEVNALSTNIGFIKSELSNIQEQIDGIKSVVESQNIQISKINKNIVSIQNYDLNNSQNIENIENDLNATKTAQVQNYQKIKLVLSELSSLIDSINNSYVSKTEFNKKIIVLKSKIDKIIEQNREKSLSQKKRKTIFLDAKLLFNKKEFTKAKLYFQESIKRRYLPATSNFYLGEIAFLNKNYPKAINFYKKSISLYSKTASFTPTLLFHTYLSFQKLGDKNNALKFKKILLSRYPNSKIAKKLKK